MASESRSLRVGCYNRLVRRLLAILIATLVALPAFSPLFALGGDSDAGRPACCRRDGKHHCMLADMSMDREMSGSSSSDQRGITASKVSEHCPYGAQVMPGAAHPDRTPQTSQAVFAGIVAHPAVAPQTESKRRVSADRSRQKRGPPASFLA